MTESPYRMTLDLNILNHLGINLYSNVPAVIAEVVANSWDADSENVTISIDPSGGSITITDDGVGMNLDDINRKYLTVGYQRRQEGSKTPRWKRPVMGRKGIGKLSLFSIANTIDVRSVKEGEKNAFRMSVSEIERHIRERRGEYLPQPIHDDLTGFSRGTQITLTDVKKNLHQAEAGLRKRLARRFSVIGASHNFAVTINGKPVSIEDRDYFHKIQYLWYYGAASASYGDLCKNMDEAFERDGHAHDGHQVTGWIGTSRRSTDLKDTDGETLNRVVVMVRGKLAQEDILDEFGEGGLYTKYVLGEIHADFLDVDDQQDIATSSRQRIIEDDPRYQALKAFLRAELKHIQNKWTELRNAAGLKHAVEIPAISAWYGELSTDDKARAKSLFGKINQLTMDSDYDRRQLLKNSVIAFESLRYKKNLEALESVTAENLQGLGNVFRALDDIEATLYYQIVKERIAVIDAMREKVESAALERAVQEHVFTHLWLLDPSWERATETAYMEETVGKAFAEIDTKLTKNERAGRLDIRYTTTSGKHVIVELKRADRVVSTTDVLEQISKYRSALRKVLQAQGRGSEPIEVVCVVGQPLKDWDSEPEGKQESADVLRAKDTRIVMYQELLQNAYKAYEQFLERHTEYGRVVRLISAIEEWTGDEGAS